jgi:CAAX protease family protein
VKRRVDRPLAHLLIGLSIVAAAWLAAGFGLSLVRNILAPATNLRESVSFATMYAVVVAGGYLVHVRFVERRSCSELRLRDAASLLPAGIGIPFVFILPCLALLRALGNLTITAVRPWTSLGPPLADGVYSGLVEEIFFRGLLFRLLEKLTGTWPALLLSALAFWAAHLGNANEQAMKSAAIALLPGVLLGAGFIAARSLWLPIGIHASWDFVLGNVAADAPGIFRIEYGGPRWLTGGPLAPDGSLPEAILILAISVALLWAARQRGRIHNRSDQPHRTVTRSSRKDLN